MLDSFQGQGDEGYLSRGSVAAEVKIMHTVYSHNRTVVVSMHHELGRSLKGYAYNIVP